MGETRHSPTLAAAQWLLPVFSRFSSFSLAALHPCFLTPPSSTACSLTSVSHCKRFAHSFLFLLHGHTSPPRCWFRDSKPVHPSALEIIRLTSFWCFCSLLLGCFDDDCFLLQPREKSGPTIRTTLEVDTSFPFLTISHTNDSSRP